MDNWKNDYMKGISKYQNLSKEELKELGKQLKNKASLSEKELNAVINTLLMHHSRLIVSIANSYTGKGIPYDELIGAGIEAILDKATDWDYTISPAFTTFITPWIAGNMKSLFKKRNRGYQHETPLIVGKEYNRNELESNDFETTISDNNDLHISSTLLYKVLKFMNLEDLNERYIFQELLCKTKLDTIQENSGLDSDTFFECLTSVKEKFKEVLYTTDLKNRLSLEEMDLIYENLHLLPSDETIFLDNKQAQFAREFSRNKTNDSLSHFYEQLSDLQDIPAYKYVMNYLIEVLDLNLEEEEKVALWNYLDGKWSFAGKPKNRSHAFMQMIRDQIQNDFQEAGISYTGNINTYMKDHILNLSEKGLRNLVLTYHMNLETYLNFRKKVLKVREEDFLDNDFIYLYLVIQYADIYDFPNWKEAYDKLDNLYSASAPEIIPESSEQTSLVREDILEYLENTNENFFVRKTAELSKQFSHIAYCKRQGIKRSPEEEFHIWWITLLINITMYHQSYINFAERRYRNKEEKSKSPQYKLGTEAVCRFLYGANTGTISPKNPCKKIMPETPDYFLDSKTFEKTRITDDVIRNFSKKTDAEKRNLLLTVIFLNFAYDVQQPEYKGLSYKKRLTNFKLEVANSLSNCGYLALHNANAYDRFLQSLFVNSIPLDLFRHIWYEKTNSFIQTRNEVISRDEQEVEK